jgi:hypothetical protein
MAKQLNPAIRAVEHSAGKNHRQSQEKAYLFQEDQGPRRQGIKKNPEYLVQSEKSGKQAAHRPGELRKVQKRSK